MAATFVVEGMPEMEFIQITQGIEFVFRVELERGVSAHASYPHNVANGLQWVPNLLPGVGGTLSRGAAAAQRALLRGGDQFAFGLRFSLGKRCSRSRLSLQRN